MGLKYQVNKLKVRPNSVVVAMEMPIYSNTSLASNKKYHSRLSPLETSTSIRNDHQIQPNIYENLSKLPPEISSDTSPTHCQIYENLKISSPIYINLNHPTDKPSSSVRTTEIDIETNVLADTTQQTVEKFDVSIVACPREKHHSHRTKIPRIPSSLLRRRTLNRPKRYRRRSSTPFRSIIHSNPTRQSPDSNPTMTTNHRSIANQLYHQIPIASEELFAYPLEFQELLAYYPGDKQHEELIQQVFSTSDNGQSLPQDESINEEVVRRPKSSSSTLASVTNTIISSETLSSEDRPPPPPPRPPPIDHRLSGIALSLDKKDVDFIHDILQRTQGDDRVSNRITALKEAYLRAANKRNELLKTKPMPQTNETKKKTIMRQSVIASKIRDELEKYDELPAYRRPISDEEEEETYSANDDYRYYRRRLPPVPSTTHRIINFMTTLKRQLQKNFQDIRSRILIETMSHPQRKHNFHHRSNPSRRPTTSHHILPRSSSHYSIEHSYPFHRQQFSRTHSNISDKYFSNRPRTFQVTPHSQRRRRRRMN